MKSEWTHEVLPQGQVQVQALLTAAPEAAAAIWRYLLDVELTSSVQIYNRPLDDPIRWLLAEWRYHHVKQIADGLWLSLLDASAALEARRYLADGELVLELDGAALLLEVRDGEGSCAPTGRRGRDRAGRPDACLHVPGRLPVHGAPRCDAAARARARRLPAGRFDVQGRARALVQLRVLKGSHMRRVNINQPEFNLTQEQPGYSWRAAELGPAIGAARMGATLYELPPGEASFPYHYEYGCEEWLLLVSGSATLRDPEGDHAAGGR